MTDLLQVEKLAAGYGLLQAVREVSLSVAESEVVALVGANGAGKSTLLRTIAGVHPATSGTIRLEDTNITELPPHCRVARGLVLVPEGRKLFPEMTVEENLLVAGRRTRPGTWTVATVLSAFPMLKPLRCKLAANLSGGEQQLAAIARALMANPRVLLIDEVSLGLAPLAVDAVYGSIHVLIRGGATLVIVEQDLQRALSVAHRVVCLLEGRIVLQSVTEAVTREQVTEAYFGLDRVNSSTTSAAKAVLKRT